MPKYSITKQFHFSASHILHGLVEGHKCGRLHGHNFIVEIVLESDTVDERGFVLDYGELAPLKGLIDHELDHRHLNEVLPNGMNPSAENLAKYLYDWSKARWSETAEVRVSETPKTWASYRGGK